MRSSLLIICLVLFSCNTKTPETPIPTFTQTSTDIKVDGKCKLDADKKIDLNPETINLEPSNSDCKK